MIETGEAGEGPDALYRRIFEATGDGVCVIAFDGGVVEANPAARAMFGYTMPEFAGLRPWQIVASESHAVLDALLQALGAYGAADARLTVVRRDGSRFIVDLNGRTVSHRGARHILAIVRNVTAQAHAYAALEGDVEERTRELGMLLDLSRRVASTLEVKPLLGLMLEGLRDVVDYGSASLLIREDDDLVEYDHQGPFSFAAMVEAGLMPEPRIPVDVYQAGWEMYLAGQSVLIDDMAGDDPFAAGFRRMAGPHADAMLSMARSFLGTPMIYKGTIVGLLNFSAPRPHQFTRRHAALVMAIATQAAVAVQNAQFYERAQVAAALEERQRLARELHDSVSQALYAIVLGARTARGLLELDPTRLSEPLDYVLEQAQAALTEMRALIFELRPEALAAEGLAAALSKQADSVRTRHRVRVEMELAGEPDVPLATKEALYRIAQEALHNTVKHAAATHVRVSLTCAKAAIALEIADDGTGFDVKGSFPGHLGLQTMRERAVRLGGRLDVDSAPGAGTRVKVRLPLGAPA